MKIIQNELLAQVEEALQVKITAMQTPPQGFDSQVFLIETAEGAEYAVKVSAEGENEIEIYELLAQSALDVPIPKVLTHFKHADNQVVVLEKINFPLLETVPDVEKYKYVGSMIANLRKLHTLKSEDCEWKQQLLDIYTDHPWFTWQEVVTRPGVDRELILSSLAKIKEKINNADLVRKSYSLLHTDFNQRNLFVDPQNHEIAGIIDWGEAMFGDPLYDFARLRMFIIHFNLGQQALDIYYDELKLDETEKKLEELYLVCQILQYVNWYSEEENEFNNGRLKLHQEFLRNYAW